MTIINVLLVTSDVDYSHRLRKYITENHGDVKLTILSSASGIAGVIGASSYSVMLIGEEFQALKLELPAGMNCGWLCSRDIGGSFGGYRRFCKYRSGETLYNMILSLYSEVSVDSGSHRAGTPVYAFTASNGGAGSTLVSAAFAVRLASGGAKTLYFSFDRYSMPSLIFDGDTHAGMSDFIFSVLSAEKRDTNLSVKAASILARDSSGVKYMQGCKSAVDMDELNPAQLAKAFAAVQSSDEYSAVVVDIPLSDAAAWEAVQKYITRLFVVSGPSVTAQQKLARTSEALRINDARKQTDLCSRCSVIINKDSQRREMTGTTDSGMPVAGYIPRYKDDSVRAVVNAISRLNMWNDCI